MEMILIYPVFIGIALVTAQLAHDKGYSGRWWFVIGILLPILSLLILLAFKKKTKKKKSTWHDKVEHVQNDKVLFKKEA
ncbi:MAG: hypothetical protein IT247_07835 [Bacteroidia bacterium]|nr:hypothetical protein [Bacteroidia bacterium]